MTATTAENPTPPAASGGGHPQRWPILGVICLAQLTVLLDNTVLNVAVPSLTRELDASTADIQWTINAYALVQSGLLRTAGNAADRYGRKRMLLTGLALFGVGSLAAGLAQGSAQLIAARADPGADWRDQLRDLAQGYRALLVRHPWLSPLVGHFLNIGPNWAAPALCVQRLIRRTGLPPARQAGGIAAVFQFVYGFGTIEGHFRERCAAAGLTQDEYFAHTMGAVDGRPELAAVTESGREVMEARGGGTVDEMRDRDFTSALDLLIAGIEARVDHWTRPSAGARGPDAP
ncbi:MFS transporter [Streptomyces sp. Act-28]